MSTPADQQKDWNTPKPAKLPRPTYWPLVLAAGIVVIAWGLVFSPWFVALGVVLAVLGLAGWVRELHADVTGAGERGSRGEREKGRGGEGK